MQILTTPPVPLAQVCIYGASGAGKTALGTHLNWGTPRWGERGIYVAADPSSEKLESIHPDDRKRLIVVKMAPKSINGKQVLDPHAEMCEICSHDWKAEYPDVGTIILDGGTELADMLLRSYANQGVFAGASGDKHLMVGEKGKSSYMAQPVRGDYGMAQNGMNHILGFLLNQPLSVIFICQETIIDVPGSATSIGGPAGAGKAATNRIASKFNTLIRAESRSTSIPNKNGMVVNSTEYRVYTEPRGIWMGKLRKPIGMDNPIAEMNVTGRVHEFWHTFDKFAVHWTDDNGGQ